MALCDNATQGIVPVPAHLGNGDNPRANLYWGALYGCKTYFKNHKNWQLVKTSPSKEKNAVILEQCLFVNDVSDTVFMQAYRGSKIKTCIQDFFAAAARKPAKNTWINSADLVVYCGHDGLMEFDLEVPSSANGLPCMVFACSSATFFGPNLKKINATPCILTKGLMAPEAYAIEGAVQTFLTTPSHLSKTNLQNIRRAAASQYSKYQKCSLKSALWLFSGSI